MSIVEVTKTSFTAGELDPHLLGRLDLKAVEDGARRLRNVIVEPTGGVRRRPGLAHVASVAGARRLVSFERPAGAVLLAFASRLVHVIDDGVIVDQVTTPFNQAALKGISLARWGDRLLVTQPETRPQEIVAIDADSWVSREWKWEVAAESSGYAATSQPFAKFARPEAILEIEGSLLDGDGNIRVGSSVELTVVGEDYFTAAHLGLILRITVVEAANVGTTSRYVDVTLDPIPGQTGSARGVIHGKLRNGHRTRRWQEQAFSDLRGWPASIAVFQDRLVIGGSRDLPDRIWISRTGQPFDMGLGTGLDDEGIAFRLGAERIHEIRSLLAGRHLQVFTSCGEWTVRGDPLTPSNVQVELQTRVGSWTQRRLQPVDVDGATLFVGSRRPRPARVPVRRQRAGLPGGRHRTARAPPHGRPCRPRLRRCPAPVHGGARRRCHGDRHHRPQQQRGGLEPTERRCRVRRFRRPSWGHPPARRSRRQRPSRPIRR